MEKKKLKINIPEGYEVDKELSTFEEIIFKKIEYGKLPRTWDEYRELTKGEKCYTLDSVECPRFGCVDEFDTKERAEEYDAIGIFTLSNEVIVTNECDINDCALTFPTQEMADKFITCFRDLIKQAFPLV